MRLTKFVVLVCSMPLIATAALLEDSAEIAARHCLPLAASSLSNCGTEMGGRSERHLVARRAVRDFYKARNLFMDDCLLRASLYLCTNETHWRTQAGIDQAMRQVYGSR